MSTGKHTGHGEDEGERDHLKSKSTEKMDTKKAMIMSRLYELVSITVLVTFVEVGIIVVLFLRVLAPRQRENLPKEKKFTLTGPVAIR